MIKTQLCFNDYSKQDRVKNSIGIVGFHPIEWRVGNVNTAHSVVYLIKTLASLLIHVEKAFVYTCVDGFEFVENLFEKNKVHIKKIDVPEEIEGHVSGDKVVRPVPKYALMQNEWKEYEFVFFTESDHVIHSIDLNNIVNRLNDNQYLAAHRFEQKYQNYNQQGQPTIKFDNKQYVLYNDWESEFSSFDSELMFANTYRSSYSAAWIAKSTALNKVDFNRFNKKALGSPCICVFSDLKCLKTKSRYGFFVDHLSGFDNALKEAGLHITMFPEKW